MSGLDRWLEEARNRWDALRVQLTRLAPPPVAPEQLADDDPARRWRAVHALVGHPRVDLLPQLLQLAGDDDPMMRAAAVDALVSWGPAIVLEPVREALAQTPAPEAAASLLEVLARLPDPANRAAIEPWLDHETPEVRAAAFMALAALCDDGDLPVLRRALREGDRNLQRAILATLCAPAATELAQRASSSSDPILRQRGERALRRIQQALAQAEKATSRRSGKASSP
jgi:HEAT repeat protein